MTLKIAEGPKGGLPPWKEGEKIDLRIAHWALWGPRVSGLYETARELIQAEMKIVGVLPFMCCLPPPNATKKIQAKYIQGGFVDPRHPQLRTQDWGYAMKHADIHLVHFSFDKRISRLEPKAFFVHGTLEACLDSSLREKDDQRSLLSAAEWIDRFEATFVTSQRAKFFWGVFDGRGGERVHLVNKGIDLEWWSRTPSRAKLDGEPSILYGEVWRGIKHPAHLLYAVNELYKENKDLRFNAWGLNTKRVFWEHFIRQAGFDEFFGKWPVPGMTDYPEHNYSRGDVLASPVIMGDVSRVHQEALACGCPVVSWDSDPWKDAHPYKYARAFDVLNLADVLKETYEEVLDDRHAVSKRCRAIAEKHFDVNEEAKGVVEALRKVVNEFRHKKG